MKKLYEQTFARLKLHIFMSFYAFYVLYAGILIYVPGVSICFSSIYLSLHWLIECLIDRLMDGWIDWIGWTDWMDWLLDGKSYWFISYLLFSHSSHVCLYNSYTFTHNYMLKSAITIMTLAAVSYSQSPSKLFFTS